MTKQIKAITDFLMPFGKSGSIYLIGALGQGLGPIILTPILTRRLSIEEFGEITFIIASASILGIIFSFGLPIVISRSYLLDKNSRNSINNWFNKIIVSYILFSLTLLFINFNIIYLIILSLSLNFSCLQLILPLARAKNKPSSFALISIIGTLLPSGLIIFNSYYTFINSNLNVLQIGAIFGSTISFLLVKSRQEKKLLLKKYSIKNSLISSFPILPHMFSMVALINIDKVIFGQQIVKTESGFVQIIMLISTSPIMILSALNHAWLNQILLQLKENLSKAFISLNKTILKLILLTGFITFIVFLIHRKLIILLNPNLKITSEITQTIILGLLSSFIYIIYLANTHLLTWLNKFWILGITTPISVFAQSLVIYLTINNLNYISAPLGLGTALTLQVLLLRFSRQNTRIQKAISSEVQVTPLIVFWITAFVFLLF